ncbi:MAG TPA: MlaD family protein, partial [Steroidobacteraceae bacterium]|nr:MlaD family protein [Steroidobacteraceae bacterium]
VVVMGALFVYWYSDSRDQRDFNRYEIYFDGSVSGLAVGGQVRYLGVDVGRVVRVTLDKRAADRVQVIVDIDASAPISERTLAQLSLQGVTGLLYIDLLLQRPGSLPERLMDPIASEHYPVIRSIRSNFDVLLSGLPQVAAQIGELASRGNKTLSNENLAAFTRLMANLDRLGSTLPQTGREASQLIAELREATAASRSLIAKINTATDAAGPDVVATAARLRASADHLASASEQLDAMLTEDRGALHGFVQHSLPQIDALLRDSRDAAREFEQLSRSLRENPAQVLYQPASAAVEIPR